MNDHRTSPHSIFITGAGGFVGRSLCLALRDRFQIRACCRYEVDEIQLRSQGLDCLRRELDQISVDDLRGFQIVVHAAALGAVWAAPEQFEKTNVADTKHLLEISKEAKVERFIYIGTEAAIFDGHPLRNADEKTPLALNSPYLYGTSKARAEDLVLKANSPNFTTLSIRPRLVWGPSDPRVKTLRKAISSGLFTWIGAGRTKGSTTHIENLIEGIVCAFSRGRGGEAYFVTDDEAWTNFRFLTEYLRTQNLVASKRSIPAWLARLLVRAQDFVWKNLGIKRPPPLPRMATEMMSVDCTVSNAKAKAELGYRPLISVATGMARMPKADS